MSRYRYLCVHGHFYQPPRGNPITGRIGAEPTSGGFWNWNERVTAESYRPNAEAGNFDRISFDIGESLMGWLQRSAPETYHRIVQADKLNVQHKKIGNALAMPIYHVILPLLKQRDKVMLLHWGKLAFRHHFGRDPQGLWLPEMAVDMKTLEVAQANGFKYVILARGQIKRGNVDDSGPYLIELENGQHIAAFIRNDDLSNDLSFNIDNVGGAGHWARNRLAGARIGSLTLIATPGETFGHHHLGEEQFLKWLLEHEAPSVGFKVVTLDEYLRDFPPTEGIEIKDFSSFSCFHGIARWSTGCRCTEGSSAWKAPLLRVLDDAADMINDLYQQAAWSAGLNAWTVRNDYVRVWLNELQGDEFLAEHNSGKALDKALEQRLLHLLAAENFIARAYTAEAFRGADFDTPDARNCIRSLAYAIYLAEQATGEMLHDDVRNELQLVTSSTTDMTGVQMYDEVMREYGFIAEAEAESEDSESESGQLPEKA